MKKILVPIDFSPASRNASEYAASLAKAFDAEVYLLHVFMEPVPASEAPVAWMIMGSELQDANDALVNEKINILKKKYLVEVSGSAKVGYKGDIIHDIAREIKADLVIMGMKEEKRSKVLGSTTLTAVRKTEIPVLVVHEGIPFVPMKHIVLAADFNEIADVSCFDLLFKIAAKFDANLQVLHVKRKGREMAASEVPGKVQLGHIFYKVSYGYQEVEDENVDHGILDYIQNHPTDLLVMIAHHHNIFERMFGTVHTRSITFESKLPVLILKDK